MIDKAYVERVVKELIDRGRPVEAGWMSYKIHVMPIDAPPGQFEECRRAFYAGAVHLFASVLRAVESDEDKGHDTLDKMRAELRLYHQDLLERHTRGPQK